VLEGDALTIELGPSTMAYCGYDWLVQQYLELLANADGYTVEDGRLVMELKADAGTMTFTQ
jgi:heat shock protein HslJ